MATLIIDIETVGYDWESISLSSQLSLTKWIGKNDDSLESNEICLQKVKNRLNLSPFTARIVSLALYDVERDIGSVYFTSDNPDNSFQTDSFTGKVRCEKEMLEDFWDGARNYDKFVTFNGRAFTIPFLYHRSAINNIRPSIDISKIRYLDRQPFPHHVDLLDEFTFYGMMQKRPSLQILADAYGIEAEVLVNGDKISEMFRQKKFRDVALSSTNDVLVIKELYEKWRDYLASQFHIDKNEL